MPTAGKGSPRSPRKLTDGSHEHQIGGHDGGIQFENGRVLKKCNKRSEIAFYTATVDHPLLRAFVPKFYGTEDRDGVTFLVLENLLEGMRRPMVLDVKMGTQTYGDDATPEKIASRLKKDTRSTTMRYGINIVGAQMPLDEFGDETERIGHKYDTEILTAEGLVTSFSQFFRTAKLMEAARDFLEQLYAFFTTQKEFAFYGSSLLFAYDAALGYEADLRIKMIDFAHVHPTPNGGLDESYLTGLRYFRQALRPT